MNARAEAHRLYAFASASTGERRRELYHAAASLFVAHYRFDNAPFHLEYARRVCAKYQIAMEPLFLHNKIGVS